MCFVDDRTFAIGQTYNNTGNVAQARTTRSPGVFRIDENGKLRSHERLLQNRVLKFPFTVAAQRYVIVCENNETLTAYDTEKSPSRRTVLAQAPPSFADVYGVNDGVVVKCSDGTIRHYVIAGGDAEWKLKHSFSVDPKDGVKADGSLVAVAYREVKPGRDALPGDVLIHDLQQAGRIIVKVPRLNESIATQCATHLAIKGKTLVVRDELKTGGSHLRVFRIGVPASSLEGGGRKQEVPDDASTQRASQYPDFSDGLVAYYPFNGNAKDESGNGNDGEARRVQYGTDRYGRQESNAQFNGASSLIEIDGLSGVVGGGRARTVTAWVHSKNAPAKAKAVITLGKELGSGTKGEAFGMQLGAEPHAWFFWGSESDFNTVVEPGSGWQSHVLTFNGSEVVYYIDGAPCAEQTMRLNTTATSLLIGKHPNHEMFFKGSIDDVRIYNRALSPDEVKALYEFESQPPGQPVGQTLPPAVAPFDMAQAKTHQKAWADYLGLPVETTNSIGMKFVVIPPGEFMKGSPEDEPGRGDNETLHKVTLTQPFQMGMHEVTQEQYQKVMGTNLRTVRNSQNPVSQVSWNDAVEFCRKLSDQPEEKAAGYVYRLPTEAEWEYACRAGTTTRYSFGDSESELGGYAWHDKNSGNTTHPVGGKKPNAWGLYDIHGNVWEWCQDWGGDYPSGEVTDPAGPSLSSQRINRGGAYYVTPEATRSAYRRYSTPGHRAIHMGFRVLRRSIK